MTGLLQDLRYALRQLRKGPGFTAGGVLTLALGIGATTAIFSVVYGVLLKPLPYADPGRIMAIFEVTTKGTWNLLADPNFDDFRDQSRSFEAIAKYSAYIAAVSGGSQPTRSMVVHVSPEFFKVFGVQPVIGRDLTAAANNKGAAPVVLVSYGYWKQYLGSSLDSAKLHLKIDNTIFTVIGVLPEGFQFPSDAALWVPADLKDENPSRSSRSQPLLHAMSSVLHEIDPDVAAFNGMSMTERIHDSPAAYLHRSSAWLAGGFAGLALLLGIVGLYGVIAYSVSQRTREIGIRMALGAQRSSVVQLILKQAARLVIVGIAAGLLCSLAAAIVMRNLLFGVRPWDLSTFIAVALLLAGCALLASYIPARRAAKVDPVVALRYE